VIVIHIKVEEKSLIIRRKKKVVAEDRMEAKVGETHIM
jgi:hypothetical protein